MGAYVDVCKELKEAMAQLAAEREKALWAHYSEMEQRVLNGLGVPPEFLNGGPGHTYSSAGIAFAQMKHQVGQWYVGMRTGRFSSSPNITLGDAGKEVQLHNNGRRRRFKVMHVHDEYVELEPSSEMVTFRPLPTENTHPGFHVACGACAYSIPCMQGRLGAICKHCRTSSMSNEALYATLVLTQKDREDLTPHYVTLAKLQPEQLRVPTACPLFQESLIICEWCKALGKKRHPVALRVFVETSRHCRKRLSTPVRTKVSLSFRQHLEKYLRRPGDPHRNRYAPQKQKRCAQRRSQDTSRKR